MNLYLDIETIPCQKPEFLRHLVQEAQAERAAVKAPSNYKDGLKIAEYIAEKHAAIDAGIDSKLRATSLNGAFGQVAVIGFAYDDGEAGTIWTREWQDPSAEFLNLRRFFDVIADHHKANLKHGRPCFIGHNITWDLRFLFQRAVVLGIKPPAFFPINPKPWEETIYDTMVQWAGVKDRVKLDEICLALGIARKGDEIGEEIDGSMVWDFVKEGRIGEVALYCAGDVDRAREAHKRMTFAGV